MKTLTLLLLTLAINVYSQKYTVSGFITDSATGEKLIGANIFNKISKQGVTSNNYGFYSFTTKNNKLTLNYTFVGYNKQQSIINLSKDTLINISLKSNNKLNEVLVIDNKLESELKSARIGVIELPIKKLKNLPVLFGETDVLRTIQLLPGVHTGGEGTAGLFVRGGGHDQNLILLDGIKIYNIYHLFGFFSVFNTDAIKKIDLYKGGFPAEYGGRLSSILDIRMKEGNTKKLKGSISVGIIAASCMLEGPIVNEKTSFIFSARRTYIDILSRPFIKDIADGSLTGYYFYDFTGKINHKFSNKSRLYLSTYTGKDNFYSKTKNKITTDERTLNWANYTAALRWNYIFNNKLFSNTTVTYSNYSYLKGMDYSRKGTKNANSTADAIYNKKYKTYDKSGIQDISGKVDFEYLLNTNNTIKFGFEYTNHIYKPKVSMYKKSSNLPKTANIDTIIGNSDMYANEMSEYIENTFNAGAFLRANVGIRHSDFYVGKKYYQKFEPRATLRFLVTNKLSIKTSYSLMSQYILLLTNTTSTLPTDLWIPVSKNIKPQYSNIFSLGSIYNLNNNINVSMEAYYKLMSNLIEYKQGATFISDTSWEEMIEVGKGWSYGVEFMIKKQFGKLTGWIGYTWSKTERQFKNINFGKSYPYKYDRRNDFNIALTYKLRKNILISADWVYGTGDAFTLAHSKIASNFSQIKNGWTRTNLYQFESRNSYRMPANHRLDIGIILKKQKKRGLRTWSLGIYNVYNRKNAFFLNYDELNKKMVAISIFPILPYFRYKFEF